MSLWAWLLVALCAAGALLAIVSVVLVLAAAKRVSRRINSIVHSRLFISLQSLSLQMERLSRLSAAPAPLVARGRTALASIRASLQALQLVQARRALGSTGAELRDLYRDLQ